MTITETESTTTTDLQVGTRYRVNTLNPEGARLDVGATVECVEIDHGIGRFQRVNDDDTLDDRRWIVYRNHLDDLASESEAFIPETVTKEEHDRIIAEKDEAILRHSAEADRLRGWQANALNDIEHVIGQNLMDEANRRDWCSDYDDIVERINNRTAVLHLPTRDNDYSCQRRVSVTVTVYVTQTGSYTGSDEPDEDDVEWNEVDHYAVREAVQSEGAYLSFEVDDDDTDDFESERS